jgi:hypothetical protein
LREHALPPRGHRTGFRSRGLTAAQERVFDWLSFALVITILAGWGVAIGDVMARRQAAIDAGLAPGASLPSVARSVSSAMFDPRSPSTPFLNEAALRFLDPLRGESGRLHAVFRTPGEPIAARPDDSLMARYESEGEVYISSEFAAPQNPGIYDFAVEVGRFRRGIENLRVVTLVPFSEKQKGRIGTYYLGTWPYESGGKPKAKAYENPVGFIRVTPENADTYVSEHFRLRDFLTKDQGDVWPKYLLLNPRLLDKLELVIEELKKDGVEVRHVHVMSGFRTPRYNESGGNTAGRANLSRHMYGDAADFYVDNNQDGYPDDITGDGKVNTADAEKAAAAAERVERRYPALVGGIGIYRACCGHGPFTHVDVRGYRARWRE